MQRNRHSEWQQADDDEDDDNNDVLMVSNNSNLHTVTPTIVLNIARNRLLNVYSRFRHSIEALMWIK